MDMSEIATKIVEAIGIDDADDLVKHLWFASSEKFTEALIEVMREKSRPEQNQSSTL